MISIKRLCTLLLLLVVVTLVAGALPPAGAIAAPLWNLDIHHDQTNFPPGGTAELSFDVRNLGDSASTGTTTLHVALPAGITLTSYRLDEGTVNGTSTSWECPGAAGKSSFVCATTTKISAGSDVRNLLLTVAVSPETAGDLVAAASLSGGGAPPAPGAADCEPTTSACATERIHVGSEPAPFGIVEGSWVADFYEADEVTPTRQAGSHPELTTFSFDLNSIEGGVTQNEETQKIPSASLRDVEVDLPPGFVGAPTAVGECSPAQLTVFSCPVSAQVGRADVSLQAGSAAASRFDISAPIYNMEHSRGSVTDLAFVLEGKTVHIKASLDPANNYAIRAVTSDINETDRAMNTKVTIWGVPGDSSHDLERASEAGTAENPVPVGTGLPVKPFITLPARCGESDRMILSHYDSWQESGVYGPPVPYELPGSFTGCDRSRFEPELSVEPTSHQADAPTGVSVRLHVPQNENPNGLGTPPVKETVVKLPEGMSFSPSVANGLSACSSAQIELGTNDEVECPDASRIGEVALSTPLLGKPLEGSVYLASQYDNPFGSLFAIYLVIHDTEERGVLIKIPGKVEADPVTGQITTTFADTPQLPFEDLTLKFRSGPRAPLVNPPTCGAHEIAARMSSWAHPGESLPLSTTYQVSEGPDGAPCPPGGMLAFNPSMVAGTMNNLAGSYSPLYLQLNRGDDEQQLTNLITKLPPGVTANLTGVPLCPDADIALARTKTGAQEAADPSCPAGSQIGHTTPEVGVGGVLTAVHGHLYLAGPYQDAPFSIVEIDSADVGPYDLGTVVNRLPLSIDPRTAVATTGPNPEQIPHILKGVIVHLREAHISVDRPNFILNSTSCDPSNFSTTLVGSGQNLASAADDVPVTVTNRYQAADCERLKFQPEVSLTTNGKSSRANGSAVRFLVRYPKNALGSQAWFKEAKFELPKQLPARLTTIQQACLAATFEHNRNACPAHSIIGHAVVHTQILPVPLEGPVYFVSYGGAAFPDAVLVLDGYGIHIELHGKTFINGKTGVTSATFADTPEVPFESIEVNLPAGPYSEFGTNLPKGSYSFCGRKLVMPTHLKAADGAQISQNTPVAFTGCPKTKSKAARLASVLKACHKKRGRKRASCEDAAHRRYKGPSSRHKHR